MKQSSKYIQQVCGYVFETWGRSGYNLEVITQEDIKVNVSSTSDIFCADSECSLFSGCFSLRISTLALLLYITRCRSCNAEKMSIFSPLEYMLHLLMLWLYYCFPLPFFIITILYWPNILTLWSQSNTWYSPYLGFVYTRA